MMLKQTIIYFTLLLQQSVVWAGSIDAVVAGLNILTQDSNAADEDVNKVNAATGLVEAQKITQDVQGLTNDANAVAFQGQGVAASQNMEVEDQITNGFNDATDSLDKFLDDLSEKASVLNELEQGSAIYTALGSLHSAYASLTGTIEGLLVDKTPKNTAYETSSDGIAALDEAQEEYEPFTV